MNYPKPKNLELTEKYTATYQRIEWDCPFCNAKNQTDQNVSESEYISDPLTLVCGICNMCCEFEKSILEL